MTKKLYVCCYDISNVKTRTKVFKAIKQQQCGGQYSAYKCYLSKREKKALEKYLVSLIEATDSLTFQIVHNIEGIIVLGRAITPTNPKFMYLG